MTLRTNINARKKMAHELLDLAKAGGNVSAAMVAWALVILGDVV
jgi:hypothetical protein